MTDSTAFLSDLTVGWAQMLDAADLGITWRPTGDYEPTEVGIGLLSLPLSLGKAIALAPYPLTDHPTLRITEVGMQIKMRAASTDPREVWDLDSTISNYLLGNYPMNLPTGVRINVLESGSSGSLGIDASDRPLWVHNYPLTLFRPTPHRA